MSVGMMRECMLSECGYEGVYAECGQDEGVYAE